MEYDEKRPLDPLCKRTCAFATTDRSKVVHKWTFLAVLMALVGTAIFYFAFSNHIYRTTFNSIIAQHTDYISKLDSLNYCPCYESVDNVNVFYIENTCDEQSVFIKTYKEDVHAINSLLETHSQRMSKDFENLTLWASVLMIVFLVFSIYAMYKVDEMQNRGHESLNSIYNARDKVRVDIDRLNDVYNKKIEELERTSQRTVDDITARVERLSQMITAEQSKYEARLKEQEKDLNTQLANILQSGRQTLLTVIEEEKVKGITETKRKFEEQAEDCRKRIDEKVAESLKQLQDEKAAAQRLFDAAKNIFGLQEVSVPTESVSESNESISKQAAEPQNDKASNNAK
ncbi:MAG: hypothetical protein HDS68_02430 [Bacteroidales bacterium]|nr:hypothetical protein [Bacteroidales bacterium]